MFIIDINEKTQMTLHYIVVVFDEWRDHSDEQQNEHALWASGSRTGIPSYSQQVRHADSYCKYTDEEVQGHLLPGIYYCDMICLIEYF